MIWYDIICIQFVKASPTATFVAAAVMDRAGAAALAFLDDAEVILYYFQCMTSCIIVAKPVSIKPNIKPNYIIIIVIIIVVIIITITTSKY